MSMNLAAKIVSKSGRGYLIEFPVQTPTEITNKMLNEKDMSKRMKIMAEYLSDSIEDSDLREILLEEVKDMLSDESLILIAI